MKTKSYPVTREEEKKVEKMVRRCLKLLKKKEYELDLPKDYLDRAVKVLQVKRTEYGRSEAGAYTIKIDLWAQDMRALHKVGMNEYKSYADHPAIGSHKCTDWDLILLTVVAHEVSHHVQYAYGYRIKRFKHTYEKPHGDCFKAIYAYLRRDLVNPLIKEHMKEQQCVA